MSNETMSALLTLFMESLYAANTLLLNPRHDQCSIDAIAAQLQVSTDLAVRNMPQRPTIEQEKYPVMVDLQLTRRASTMTYWLDKSSTDSTYHLTSASPMRFVLDLANL
jgi:hypothetical protein